MLPPPCFTIGMVPGCLQMWCLAFRPKNSILVSSDQRISWSESPLGAFWLNSSGLSCAFYWGVASVCLVECCRDGCPSGRFSHLHRGTLELCQSDHQILVHLPDQSPSSLIAKFGQVAIFRKSLDSSKLLLFKNDGGHCVLGDLQCCRNVLVPFPRFVSQPNPVSELNRQFLRPHGLVFALTCTVNCGTSCRRVCISKSCPINWITTGGLQSSRRNISMMFNGSMMHLSSISSLIAKGLNTYVNKVFQLFF